MSPEIYSPEDLPPVYELADARIKITPEKELVECDNIPIFLSPIEFNLLTHLAQQPDTTVSAEEICNTIWGEDNRYNRASAQATIYNLRKKLGPELGDVESGAIRTRRGLGYVAVSSLAGYNLPTQVKEEPIYTVASDRIKVITAEQIVLRDGEVLESITPTQFKILSYLASRPNKITGIIPLCMKVWEEADQQMEAKVRVHISQIRKKLGPELGNKKKGAIKTVIDVGYYVVKYLE